MYKVFFNDRIVFINSNGNGAVGHGFIHPNISSYNEFAKAWDVFFHSGEIGSMCIELTHEELVEAFINKYFIRIYAAGGLVYNKNNELLCIRRLGKWDLPKGKIEKKEKPEQAALREVEEETGLMNIKITGVKGSTFHVYRSVHHNNSWVFKTTYWYTMKFNGNETPVPQTSEHITEVKWCEPSFIAANTYASIKQLLVGLD